MGRVYNHFGIFLTRENRLHDAEQAHRSALDVLEKLSIDFPNQGYIGWLASEYGNLAILLSAQGRPEEADKAYRRLLELAPQDARVHNNLSWLLATCADPRLRDGKRAVELAKKAVELEPKQGMWWNTLGAAHFGPATGRRRSAAMDKSMELGKGGDGNDWFFLAMAHWQLGDKTQARSWYDKAIPWMEKNQPKNEELVRFRAEAAALLEVNEKQH